ncbi:unnamed protein product [Orchesella dallaii]|uniref:Beta-lactamase-related domain-containing protein n=1 Tax=Orchesella dallaii TaxID=48710 RepID=A0ABP1QQ83_9HEXA
MGNNLLERLLVPAIIVVGVIIIDSSRSQTDIKEKIHDFIENVYLPASNITALGLSVVQITGNEGELVYSTGYGYADLEKLIPNGNETQFLVGSITKSLTSSVVVKTLSEKWPELGEAVLDTPIRKLILNYNFTLIDRFRSEHATFRDLLSHRLCIFRDDLQLIAEPFNTVAEITYRLRYQEEICGVRTEYQYNNQMYVVAGELIGLIANQSYENLVLDLLTQIGMLDSAFVQRTDDFPNMDFRAKPYYVMDNISYPMNTELLKRLTLSVSAGGLFTTPNDMIKYMQFHLNLGRVKEVQIIPEDAMRWLRKPAIHVPSLGFKHATDEKIADVFAYGLGLRLGTYDGWQYIQHTGYFPPYYSHMSLFPDLKIGIFTTTNQGPVEVDSLVLHTFIFETLRGTENAVEKAMQNWKEIKTKSRKAYNEREKAFSEVLLQSKKPEIHQSFKNIVGNYGSGGSGDLEVLEKFNNITNTTALYMRYGKWAKGWLEEVGNDMYKIIWDTDIIQDYYAAGERDSGNYAVIRNGNLEFVQSAFEGLILPFLGNFKLGVSLETLPTIPWDSDSCGIDSE